MWTAGVREDHQVGEWCEDHYRLEKTFTVTLRNGRGKQFRYIGPLMASTEQAARALANRINTHAASNPHWEMKAKHWSAIEPVYGSEEWERSGEEADWSAIERQMDEDGYGDPRLAYL